MLRFKLVCSPTYYLPLGQNVVPEQKYRLICKSILARGIAGPGDFVEPAPASDEDVLLAHTPEYVKKLRQGTLSQNEQERLEVPFYPELVEAYWLCAGGTILAAECALRDGISFNIGGGFHHAFADHGEGFNLINDVAVAIRRMQKDEKIKTAMTVDCDVHQGNGTASIFCPRNAAQGPLGSDTTGTSTTLPYLRESPAQDVFTISLHQENNYPAWKPPSSIDVGLPDHTDDGEYLEWLDRALALGLRRCQPDLICYIAGADPYERDQLGGLGPSSEGLMRRDEMVFKAAKVREIPVAVTMGGGYAFHVRETVAIHCNTVLAAKQVFG